MCQKAGFIPKRESRDTVDLSSQRFQKRQAHGAQKQAGRNKVPAQEGNFLLDMLSHWKETALVSANRVVLYFNVLKFSHAHFWA